MTLARIAPQPHLVLFDLDDTLCDYAERASAGCAARLAMRWRRSRAESRSILMRWLRSRSRSNRTAPSFRRDARQAWREPRGSGQSRPGKVYANRFLRLQLFPGAMALLDDLRALDPAPRIGLVTNGPADVQKRNSIFSVSRTQDRFRADLRIVRLSETRSPHF